MHITAILGRASAAFAAPLSRLLRKRATLFAALLLIGVLGFLGWFWTFDDPPHLTDAELIARFHKQRAEFEKLRNMIIEDRGLFRVSYERTLPEDPQSVGVSGSRIAEYRALLKRLGIRGGIAASEDKTSIELTASFRGFVTHNSQKGYVYTKSDRISPHLLQDLDQFLKSEVGSGLRRIDDNWYLFFDGY